jgi:HSP90 family molecular chaperone
MQERFRQGAGGNVLQNYAELLLGHALIADRSELPDPVRFNHLVADLMVRSL